MGELVEFRKGQSLEVDEGLGLVFGWGIVCTKDGADYYDLQGDHIPDVIMLKAASDFMRNARVAKDMHSGAPIGMIIHSFPLTEEIAKAYKIQCDRTGWMVAFKPDDAAVLKMFRDGDRTGFSIGGQCSYEVEDPDYQRAA